ncbi:17370_t:CDS:2 [Acaulospora colombiana]|uniref:17370_t:CDS:1 n=1 Tax=Acaulospora colombiana TaxID=27376 RepID=A0ACA9KBT1_9GLOM|nr:17370_t:CDS:2 [Acaulospora colombiana]
MSMFKASLLPVHHLASPAFHQRRNSFAQVSDHLIKTRKFRILGVTLGLFLCSLWIVANFSGTEFNINTLRRFKHNDAAIAAASVMGEGGEEGIHGLEIQIHGRIWSTRRRYDIHKIDLDYDDDSVKDASLSFNKIKDDEEEIRRALVRFIYLDTLPIIFVDSRSIGGSEELALMHGSGRLEELLIEAGVLNHEQVPTFHTTL